MTWCTQLCWAARRTPNHALNRGHRSTADPPEKHLINKKSTPQRGPGSPYVWHGLPTHHWPSFGPQLLASPPATSQPDIRMGADVHLPWPWWPSPCPLGSLAAFLTFFFTHKSSSRA